MQWLQSTFANRFNRFVHERGHGFQGRYQALLVEEGESLLRVVNYIHLNPVRAGLQTIETLKAYSYGSFPKYFQRRCPSCLDSDDWLREAGDLKRTLAGLRCYHKYLGTVAESNPQKRDALLGAPTQNESAFERLIFPLDGVRLHPPSSDGLLRLPCQRQKRSLSVRRSFC